MFEDVFDQKIEHDAYAGLTILGIQREEVKREGVAFPRTLWSWEMSCVEATWRFTAHGFRQFIRREPILLGKQRLTAEQRGGFSFEFPKE